MIGASLFQTLLNSIGAILAWLYHLIPNYGLTIIILTLGIRLLLLPLGIKQIRSMQAMQAIQPKVKALQVKYKGKGTEGKQKLQEETMKLYREHGVNPFGGCLPILAQFPVLIALFAVLNVPKGLPHVLGSAAHPTKLYRDIITSGQASGIKFLGANLTCSAIEAGTTVDVPQEDGIVLPRGQTIRLSNGERKPGFTKDCGDSGTVKIPFYLFLVAMVGTTFYQQRQMQRASPGQSQQQRMLTYFMPVFFGWIGLRFPAGLVVYWTTTNLVQIGQQHFMLPRLAKEAGGDGSQRPKPTGGGPRGGSGSGNGPGGRGGQGRGQSGRRPGRMGGPASRGGIKRTGSRPARDDPGGKGTGAAGRDASRRGSPPSQEDGTEQAHGGARGASDGSGRSQARPLGGATGGAHPESGAGGKRASGGRRDGDRKKRRKR